MNKYIFIVALAGVLWAACGQIVFGQSVNGLPQTSRWATKAEVLGTKSLTADSTILIVAIYQQVTVNQKTDSVSVDMVGSEVFTTSQEEVAGGSASYGLRSPNKHPEWASKNIIMLAEPQGDVVAIGDSQEFKWRNKGVTLIHQSQGKIAKIVEVDGKIFGSVVFQVISYSFYVGPRL